MRRMRSRITRPRLICYAWADDKEGAVNGIIAVCGSRFIGDRVLAKDRPAAAGSPMNRLLQRAGAFANLRERPVAQQLAVLPHGNHRLLPARLHVARLERRRAIGERHGAVAAVLTMADEGHAAALGRLALVGDGVLPDIAPFAIDTHGRALQRELLGVAREFLQQRATHAES